LGVARHEPEERRGDHPRARHPVRPREHPDLLDVRHLADVDLLRELPQHGRLDVLVGPEPAAGQRPPALVRRLGPAPREH
jgi:hypothetical protein